MRRLLLILTLMVLYVLIVRSGLIELVSKWLYGPLGSSTTWGPSPLSWWGRIGKYLQFLGGLVALLDLVDPEKIRASALRASIQAGELRKTLQASSYLSDLLRLERVVLTRTILSNPTDWRGWADRAEQDKEAER
ncbi:hypothetical protein [Nonomuraea sp. NPDC048826]|uniref:hypothetical protein n=1 Tax=Nonomuraea sp. NPDC048826 TaxID=3364347 RepID=UPI003714CB3E